MTIKLCLLGHRNDLQLDGNLGAQWNINQGLQHLLRLDWNKRIPSFWSLCAGGVD